jgi:hypothetical protein
MLTWVIWEGCSMKFTSCIVLTGDNHRRNFISLYYYAGIALCLKRAALATPFGSIFLFHPKCNCAQHSSGSSYLYPNVRTAATLASRIQKGAWQQFERHGAQQFHLHVSSHNNIYDQKAAKNRGEGVTELYLI